MTSWPNGVTHVVFHTAVACVTPRTAAIDFRSPGVTGPDVGPGWIRRSEPGVGQGAGGFAGGDTLLRVLMLPVPEKVTRLGGSTSSNAGGSPVSEDRAAADSATKPV